MQSVSRRRILFALLALSFVIQTTLVYMDGSGYETPALSEKAQAGQRIWRSHNCQSCHQLYGFGGFLGPDLTNSVQHLADERLQAILTEGMAPMPAFQLSSHEIEAVSRFLAEVDATGTGQFRFVTIPAGSETFAQLVAALSNQEPLSEQATQGYKLVREKKCIGCHLPNLFSTERAPDLCHLVDSPGEQGIKATLQTGRILRGMPPFTFSDDEHEAVISFLHWMNDHQVELQAGFDAVSDKNSDRPLIPWFEYSK